MKVVLKYATPDIERNIAECASICYDSKVTKPEQLVKRLKHDSHFATFRFGSVVFEISEMSRAASMQMLRHKFLDFLQRSQRYVKEFGFEYVTPPEIKDNPTARVEYNYLMREAELVYTRLVGWGIKAEDARYVLPNACYTKMNVTGSIQAWWDFLYGDAGRLQPKAQWEIREFAQEIERQLKIIAPTIFKGNNESN